MPLGPSIDQGPPPPPGVGSAQSTSVSQLAGPGPSGGPATVPNKAVIQELMLIDQQMDRVGKLMPDLAAIMNQLKMTMRQQVAPVVLGAATPPQPQVMSPVPPPPGGVPQGGPLVAGGAGPGMQ